MCSIQAKMHSNIPNQIRLTNKGRVRLKNVLRYYKLIPLALDKIRAIPVVSE